MGASVEAKVSKTAFCKVSDPKKIGKQIMSLYPMPHLSPLITEEVDWFESFLSNLYFNLLKWNENVAFIKNKILSMQMNHGKREVTV